MIDDCAQQVPFTRRNHHSVKVIIIHQDHAEDEQSK